MMDNLTSQQLIDELQRRLYAIPVEKLRKIYTVIVVSGPDDGTIYPSICYNGKKPILTQYKHIAEFERNKLAEWAAEWAPAAEYKVGEINV